MVMRTSCYKTKPFFFFLAPTACFPVDDAPGAFLAGGFLLLPDAFALAFEDAGDLASCFLYSAGDVYFF